MTDHAEIYLEPECCADPYGEIGRTWCQDDIYNCEDGIGPTKYIRANIHAAALARIARLEMALERLENLTAHDAAIVAAALAEQEPKTIQRLDQ